MRLTLQEARDRLFNSVRNGDSVDKVRTIVEQTRRHHGYKVDTLLDDWDGGNILHVAIRCHQARRESMTAVLRYLINKHPELLSRGTMHQNGGQLPLHVALTRRAVPPDVLRLMLKKYPKSAARATIADCNTALHLAVTHHGGAATSATAAVIRHLISLHPQSITMRNARGDTPLHILLGRYRGAEKQQQQQDVSLYQLMIDRAPSRSVQCFTKTGATLLHSACYNIDVSLNELEATHEGWPVACLCFAMMPAGHHSSAVRKELPLDTLMRRCGGDAAAARTRGQAVFEWTSDVFFIFLQVLFAAVVPAATVAAARRHINAVVDSGEESNCWPSSGVLQGPSSYQIVKDSFLMKCSTRQQQERLMHQVLDLASLQALIKDDEPFENLIVSLKRMNEAGRLDYLQQKNDKHELGMHILLASNDSLDSLYWFLRETQGLLCLQRRQ